MAIFLITATREPSLVEKAIIDFLLAAFSKGERANLSKAERNALATISKAIVAEYRARVVKARA
jgi:hypothetical protein